MDAASVPMPRKRSRSQGPGRGHDGSAYPPAKHLKRENAAHPTIAGHALLAQHYAEIGTLRQYVVSKLPASSRLRRKKIALVGQRTSSEKALTEEELALKELLDTTIVASREHAGDPKDYRWQHWVSFSQKGDESYVTLSDGLQGSLYSQSEVSQWYRQTTTC
jgi:telomerase reverse transcriptase